MVPVESTGILQAATPTPEAGPEAVGDVLPLASRAAWFGVGFLLVFLPGWYLFEPLLSRGIRRGTQQPDPPGGPLPLHAAPRHPRRDRDRCRFRGVRPHHRGSAIVIAAATLAIGVAGQSVIGSLVSVIVLVFDPEFNVGNHLE